MEKVELVAKAFSLLEEVGYNVSEEWDWEILDLIRDSLVIEYLIKDETALGKDIRNLFLRKDSFSTIERAALLAFFSKPLYELLEG